MEQSVKDSLIEKMGTANQLLQEINDALGRETSEIEKDLKLRFPRGYIRTADEFRNMFQCVKDDTMKSNIAYQLILSDVFSWLLNRTDLFGTSKEMLIKYEIALMSSVAESLLVIFAIGEKSYRSRLAYLVNNKIITRKVGIELWWLWKFRKGIHLFEIDVKEHQKYKEEHFDRAVIAVRNMVHELNTKCK